MTAPSATAPSALQRLGLGDFDNEMASTRRILERVPNAHFDWRPHAKSGTLGTLASHVASVIGLQNAVLRSDELDILALDMRADLVQPGEDRLRLRHRSVRAASLRNGRYLQGRQLTLL